MVSAAGVADGLGAKVAPAVVMSLVVLPALLWFVRPARRRLALVRPLQGVALGGAVTGAAAGASFGALALAGHLQVDVVDGGQLALFLVGNLVVAAALEALPEELTLRGAVYGELATRTRAALAGVVTTVLFLAAPACGISLAALAGGVVGLDLGRPGLAPEGQDPVAYLVLLACFGTMLVSARAATGSVWTCVAAHLVFLTVNRALVSSGSWQTGLQVDAAAGHELLVLVYLGLATLGFAWIGRRRAGRA
ncbi:hypothetical protein GCM10009797_35170 [Nocardioides hwasunensis]